MTEVLDNKELTEKLGALTEFINDKLDIDAMNSNSSTGVGLNSNGIRYVTEVSDKSILPRWYRVYSDSWCEQGGITANEASTTVSFLKPFSNTNYYINFLSNAAHSSNPRDYFSDKTEESCTLATYTTSVKIWQACGYIS